MLQHSCRDWMKTYMAATNEPFRLLVNSHSIVSSVELILNLQNVFLVALKCTEMHFTFEFVSP